MKGLIVLCAAALAVTMLYGLGGFGGGDTNPASAAVARVNGLDIPYGEYQSVYRNLVQQYEMYVGPLSGLDLESVGYEALSQLIDARLVLAAARSERVSIPRADLDAEIDMIKAQFASDAEFRQVLRDNGLTERQLRDLIEEDLLIERMQEMRLSEVAVTDEDLRAAFEEVHARHILVQPVGDNWDAALARAEELLGRIRAGEDFAMLAMEHSQDPGSGARGGDLGYFGRGLMVPEFEEVAFSLGVGQVSEPVRSQFGYHIIEVMDHIVAEGEEFEAAKESLRSQLVADAGRNNLQSWLSLLRREAQVEIHDPQLRAHHFVVSGQLPQAISQYEAAIEQSPNNGYLHASLGQVYDLLGDAERALEQFELAALKAPASDTHVILGLMYLDAGREDDGVNALLTASELALLEPAGYMMQSRIAQILQATDRTDAIEIVEARLDEAIGRLQAQQELFMQQQLDQEALLQQLQAELEAQGAASDEPANP